MVPRDLFATAIRVFGLYYAFRGFNDLLYVFFFSIGATDDSVNKTFPSTNLIYGVAFFFGGLYLLRGGASIVNFAFPNDRDDSGNIQEELPIDTEHPGSDAE